MIYFYKDGAYIEYEDGELEKMPCKFDIRGCYDIPLFFGEGVNLGDLFKILQPNLKIIEQDFESWYPSIKLGEFFREVKKDSKSPINHIDFLEFKKELQVNIVIDKYTKDDYSGYFHDTTFQGISKGGDHYSHNVDMIPLNDMKHLPIIVNEVCIFKHFIDRGPTKKPTYDVCVFDAQVTLHEMICSFIGEITLNGSIKDRNDIIKDFNLIDGQGGGLEESVDEWKIKRLQDRLVLEEEKENFDICHKISEDIKILINRVKKNKK